MKGCAVDSLNLHHHVRCRRHSNRHFQLSLYGFLCRNVRTVPFSSLNLSIPSSSFLHSVFVLYTLGCQSHFTFDICCTKYQYNNTIFFYKKQHFSSYFYSNFMYFNLLFIISITVCFEC